MPTNSTPGVVTAGDRALLSPLCSVTAWLSSCLWVADGACRKTPERATLEQFRIRFNDKNQLENHVVVVERRERGLENLSGPFWVQNSTQSQERLHLERAT